MMGIIYSVVPFDGEVNEPVLLEWFREAWGLEIPPDAAPGRQPSLNELRCALEGLPEVDIWYSEEGNFWQAEVVGPAEQRAFITTLDRHDDDHRPQNFDIEGDFDLLAAVLARLTSLCGTLLLFQNGEDPILFV